MKKTLSIPLILAMLLYSVTFATQAASDKKTTPEATLSPEFIFKFLVGEIAGQRGDVSSASAILYDLAKSTGDARLAERAARAALYIKQGPMALQAATLWAELDPNSAEARQIVTQLLLASGKLADLRPHLKKMLADEANRANGFMYIAGTLSRNQDKAQTLQLIQELARPYPNLAEAHFAVAHAAWSAGNEQLALSELQAADVAKPGWEIGALLHGQILQARPTEVLHFYETFLVAYPASLEVKLAYAKLLVTEKQMDAAQQQFEQLVEAKPDSPDIHVAIGLLSVQAEDLSNAENHFKQALALNYKDVDQIRFYLAQISEQMQQTEESKNWYESINPDSRFYLEGQLKMAAGEAKNGQLETARNRLHNIPNLNSEQQALVIQTEASLFSQANRHQEAFDLLQNAIANYPNSPDIVYDYAMVAERVKHFDIMEHELRKLMLMKPDFAQAYNALGYTLAERNERLDEAQKLIEKALALTPDDHFILDSMGWVHYRMGRLDEALQFIQRAYDTQPDPEIAAHLGEVLWQQGKHEEAISTWEAALREFPDNEVLVNTAKKFHP
ncbi:MAG: tetratricopeptide repeat protein [Methylophilaceae bacterium]